MRVRYDPDTALIGTIVKFSGAYHRPAAGGGFEVKGNYGFVSVPGRADDVFFHATRTFARHTDTEAILRHDEGREKDCAASVKVGNRVRLWLEPRRPNRAERVELSWDT